LEIISIPADELRTFDFGLVGHVMMVVILDERDGLLRRRSRNESRADPVMDQGPARLNG